MNCKHCLRPLRLQRPVNPINPQLQDEFESEVCPVAYRSGLLIWEHQPERKFDIIEHLKDETRAIQANICALPDTDDLRSASSADIQEFDKDFLRSMNVVW